MSSSNQQQPKKKSSSTSASPQRKAFVAGDYAVYIEEELGRGSFSKVYPATLLSNPAPRGKEEYAAKYCELKDSISRDRFDEEANNVVRIHDKFHVPYIVRLIKRYLTKSSDDSVPNKGILIYEMCRGPSLHTILLRNGPLPPHLVHRFLAQMVEALACSHARGCEVVHRDVKPENFLLTSPDLESANLVLIDFGFSIRTEGREPCGTPTFMSPEVLSGNLHGPPTDIFSLGVTILCMMFGLQPSEQYGVLLRMPHPPISITSKFVRESVDEGSPYFRLREIVAACVETDPKRRPTAMQLRADEWIRSAGIVTARKIGHGTSASASPPSANHQHQTNNATNQNQQKEKQSEQADPKNSNIEPTTKPSTTSTNPKSNDASKTNNNSTETTAKEMLVPQIEQTTAERVKNSFILQTDGFSDRIQALLTIANTLHLPARRATICVKVARILCHEVHSKHQQPTGGPQSPNSVRNNNNNSFTNTSFLSDKSNNVKDLVNHTLTSASSFFSTLGGTNTTQPLLEQLQWVKSQLASMMNVLPDDEPLPDCDVAISDGVKNLASAALRAMLLGETECCYGECVGVIRFCRIALKKDLAHYSELNSLRKKLDAFALVA